ncbi:translocation/assembly module TamB domain-containing protein [Erythrobacter sp. LQ02-29]|uniref:translocation/assembly module TamB domain-containing protein n=1 Tax=Erythrobacter sp. LQ02-29 TaxID=2920384 RepID=UPI001F4E536A|nr:translocation/assembly module TamB domain-containing protein [Erythrobacter sp. LQ02-29]MCP9221565.1 translocation/assembly module TamB domain-containing protein [Erythrobacter sp. LQ02-29]
MTEIEDQEPIAQPEEHSGPERERGPILRKIAKWTAIVLAGLVLLVGAALVFLDTAPGHRFIAGQVEGLEFQNGMQIGIGEIEGSIYGEMTVRNLSIRDPKGEFLSSPQVNLDWRPFAFARSHVDIRSLTAGLVTLKRLPEFNPTPPSDEPLLPDLDIDINQLKIDRFVAEAPVSGERRVASIAGNAHIADGRAQVALNGATIAGQGSAGGDRIALKLDAVPEDNRLALDLDLNAPADGVIAALAGLTDPLRVRINGSGDWKQWNGRLDANLAGSEFARLRLLARDGTFGLRGPTRIARLFEGPTATLLGPVLNVDLTAALNERRANLRGGVSSDAFRLDTQGTVDLGESAFDGLKLQFTLLEPSAIAPNLSGRGLQARLALDGAFTTPSVDYVINAAQVSMNDMGLVDLTASGSATVNSDRILIPVSARVGRITGLDTVAGGTLANVRLNGDVAIDGTRILSDNMRIRSDRIDAKVILLADTATGLYTGAIDGRIDNYRVESVGIFNIETDVDLETAANGGWALAGRVRVRSTSLFNESVRNFLGGNAVAATNIRYGTDGTVRFTGLTLSAPAARITGGSGSYSPDGRIVLNADGFTDAYGRVGVRVAGTISNPQATITAERPGLGIGIANLRARITGARNGYRLDATADTDYGPLTADVVLGTGRQLTVDINSANLAGIDFAGSLRQTPAGPFAGQLTAEGQGLGGVVRLDAQGKYQEALVNLRAKNTVLPGPAQLSIGSAIVDARVVLYDTPYVVADAQLAQTTLGSLNLTAARAQVDYRGGRGTAKVLAEGVSGVPFRIAANADLTPKLWRAALNGRARGIDFRTTSPARIIPRGGSYELLPTRIDFGQGNIRLAGTYGNGIKLQSRLDRLDLSLVNAFVPGLGVSGKATGSLDFAQASSTAFPRADARLSINGFTRTTAASVSQPIDINFVGKLLADGGEARAVMRRGGTVIGRLVTSLRPLSAGSGSWVTRVLEAPLSGGIRYNGPADTLFSFAGQPDQRLSGPIGVAADFSGRVSQPQLSGIIRANSLTYENQTYGTRLSNMAIQGRFSGDRIELQQLRATAGDGTVQAQGSVSLASDSGYPMDVRVTLDDARLARSDAISATATGNLRLQKTAGQTALISGQIRLPETRYQIIRQGAAEVPELTGVRFKPPKGPQRITGDEPATPSAGLFDQLRLDIALTAPERLYVSGMGLESEWEADLKLGGTSTAPRLSGSVNLVRGTLGFANRSFELTEGRVRFTGGTTIDPVIALTASDDIEDVTVNVNVSGRAMNPQIAFSSTPGLPQDEILSRILFGSSIGNLSTIQAVQLAASLNSLRGSGGGLNPLGKLRSATGVDRLRILGGDETQGRGTAIAAGKYITDDIYVEFITDARGFTATQLEISLTPALSILSQAGGSGSTNVNVRYRKNY